MDREGHRTTNVFEQLCALNIMGQCSHFEPRLIMYISKFLLPSEQQHKPYYGYAGKSLGAQIDCTYEQLKIYGEICTKAEYFAHNFVHADELLDDGWDYQSADDSEYEP